MEGIGLTGNVEYLKIEIRSRIKRLGERDNRRKTGCTKDRHHQEDKRALEGVYERRNQQSPQNGSADK